MGSLVAEPKWEQSLVGILDEAAAAEQRGDQPARQEAVRRFVVETFLCPAHVLPQSGKAALAAVALSIGESTVPVP